jgi:hypothetical protein
MIRADEEFWDVERASYDDELDAWRERTAFAPVLGSALISSNGHPQTVGRDRRPRIWSYGNGLNARPSRPAARDRRPLRNRVQRSAHDRMTRSARG